jgi:hypothetical protein|tara:strand:+ start:414 stop:779 length:366 start_codon:yes stop_codon:yes gene_type:complete
MIDKKDIFEAAGRNFNIDVMQYLGDGLYVLSMLDDTEPPQKLNSYAVMKVLNPTWYAMCFAPRNLTKEMADSIDAADAQYDEQFCLQPPVRVAEEWDESSDLTIGELETLEDFSNNWEEVE